MRTLLLATLAFASAAHAAEVYVVNRAQDLRFAPLKEPFVQVRARFEGHVDLMDRLRREAFKRLSDEWGIPPADKKDVQFGCVARSDSAGRLSYALVLRGEIEPAKLADKILDQHRRAAKRRGVTTTVEAATVQGHAASRFPYLERAMTFTLVPLDKMVVLAAQPKGEDALLDEVLAALKEPDKLGRGPVPQVVVNGHVKLSESERKRVQDFQTRQIASPVKKIRDRFKQLHDRLRPGGAKEEDLKSLDERMTEQFLKATDYELKLTYNPSPETYRGKYVMTFATPEDATRMRELLLEKALFFRENAANPGIPRALDTVTIDAQGPAVTVRTELDTPEKRHDAAFSYVAFLLSFAGADRSLGIARGK